jgi:hypothetical protein
MKKFLKKIIVVSIVILGATTLTFSQKKANKPSIMVVPTDAWCVLNKYVIELDNQGTKTIIPNYKQALQQSLVDNTGLTQVIGKIDELMVAREFPPIVLEEQIKILEKKAAKKSMSGASTNPISQLKKVAKADIWLYIEWIINTIGPKKSVTFKLEGVDAYTGKPVGGASGTGNELIGATLPVMLETAVLSHIDNFNNQLQAHFDDLFANGREVTLAIEKLESFSGNLSTEFGGQALSRQIKDWMKKNTVNGKFNQADADDDGMEFNQVRIPLFDKDNNPTDTQTWAEGLQDYLKTIGVTSTRVEMDGLGSATIIIK